MAQTIIADFNTQNWLITPAVLSHDCVPLKQSGRNASR